MKKTNRLLALLFGIAIVIGSVTILTVQNRPDIIPAEGQGAAHPGGPFALNFRAPVPPGTAISFVDEQGNSLDFAITFSGDGRSIHVEPENALKWLANYRLCGETPRPVPQRWLSGAQRTCATFSTKAKSPPTGPPDAPILVAEGADRPFSRFLSAILQAEGLNMFSTSPLEDLSHSELAGRSVIILDSAKLPPTLEDDLAAWVEGGGLLIAMRPGQGLRRSLGLSTDLDGTTRQAFLRTDGTSPITSGLSAAPLLLHGPIDRYSGDTGAETASAVLATLADHAGEVLPFPAVALTELGHGHVVTFSFDLAQSVVLTRQGNPLWIGEDRDSSEPKRPNDLFYPDFVKLDYAVVPSADELQRLLANIILSIAPMPLPRFWYLPGTRRAAIIMAGDDHATEDGSLGLFKRLEELSAPDCDLDRWECLRATAYLSPGTEFQPDVAKHFSDQGFEIGVHVDTGCASPKSRASLARTMREQVDEFRATYPDLPAQSSHRMHCIAWDGWVDVPKAEREMGIRFDLNYYNWPPEWIDGRQVFLVGSGFPMPFADLNGDLLDIYQSATHLVNEAGVPHRYSITQMLDRALGPDQYFGAFGTHYDYTDGYSLHLLDLARKHGVALITAGQMLTWLDARNGSGFSDITWEDQTLTFSVALADNADKASVMLPMNFGNLDLFDVSCADGRLQPTAATIKGLSMAFFPATLGKCTARYIRALMETKSGPGLRQ